MNCDNYNCPPYGPIPPPCQVRKYFFVVLFLKPKVYNLKGQAIVFRRRTIQSLMKLIYDFDQAYLHTSLQKSYDMKSLCHKNNVDFLVKYDDRLQHVLDLIDQNQYVIKLSWQSNVQLPPCPPCPGPCPPPPCPPPYGPIPPCPPHPIPPDCMYPPSKSQMVGQIVKMEDDIEQIKKILSGNIVQQQQYEEAFKDLASSLSCYINSNQQ